MDGLDVDNYGSKVRYSVAAVSYYDFLKIFFFFFEFLMQ